MSKYGRGGRQWQAARDELKARGDAYCWRGCGTWLLADAPRWHPQFMTIGHYLALEEGGDPYDPANYGPECKPCNFSDGARRTNQKLGNPHRLRSGEYVPPEHPVVDPEWYEAYQVGTPMVFDQTLTIGGCPICGHTVPAKRTYCSPACRTEYRRRTSRARYYRKVGILNSLELPSTFGSLSFF